MLCFAYENWRDVGRGTRNRVAIHRYQGCPSVQRERGGKDDATSNGKWHSLGDCASLDDAREKADGLPLRWPSECTAVVPCGKCFPGANEQS